MATSSNGNYSKITTISNNNTFKYKKTKLSVAKNYYFKIRAYRTVENKTYYVRIRAYRTVNGKKIYSGWSKVKNITTKK